MDLMEKMEYLQHGDDILIDQNKNFLRTILGVSVRQYFVFVASLIRAR